MKGMRLLYAVYALALLLLVIVVPLMTHGDGSGAVKGWTALVDPGPLSPATCFPEGGLRNLPYTAQGRRAGQMHCLPCRDGLWHQGIDAVSRQREAMHNLSCRT
jgi:hypothetical protein